MSALMNMVLPAYITYKGKTLLHPQVAQKISLLLFFKTSRNMISIFLLFSSRYRTSWLLYTFWQFQHIESNTFQKSLVKVNSDCVGRFFSHFILDLRQLTKDKLRLRIILLTLLNHVKETFFQKEFSPTTPTLWEISQLTCETRLIMVCCVCGPV